MILPDTRDQHLNPMLDTVFSCEVILFLLQIYLADDSLD